MDNYTAMCDCQEIREQWTPKYGDEFHDPQLQGPHYMQFDRPHDGDVKERGCIWLPRQEDWQRLIQPRFITMLATHNRFLDFWIEQPGLFETPVEYWCAFYMMLFREKTWDGKWK